MITFFIISGKFMVVILLLTFGMREIANRKRLGACIRSIVAERSVDYTPRKAIKIWLLTFGAVRTQRIKLNFLEWYLLNKCGGGCVLWCRCPFRSEDDFD